MKSSTFVKLILFLIVPYIISSCMSLLTLRDGGPIQKDLLFNGLPTRAFEFDGGVIAYQVFATRNTSSFADEWPVKYFLNIKNESKIQVYSIVEWQFTNKDIAKMSSKKYLPGYSYRIVKWGKGVMDEVELPLTISIFADMNHSKKVGEEKTVIFFDKKSADTFREAIANNKFPLIIGFPEMKSSLIKSNVPGASGDDTLQRDIQLLLWKEESRKRRDCEHEALKAKKVEIKTSKILSKFEIELKEITLRLAGKGLAFMEIWNIRSCETESSYEVLMVKDPKSGTNIITRLIE